LLLWAGLASIGFLFGAAVAAELEYVRASLPHETDPSQVSLPDLEFAGAAR
jgi:hypothetical protein